MKPNIEYLPDSRIDGATDQELRGLLTTCFTKPQDVVFRERRYFREPYPNRWVIRDRRAAIVAHVGVHEKSVESDGTLYRIGGIAEVCVHPGHRGKGYVRLMLGNIHEWLARKGFIFAVLFGEPMVYNSSGYMQIANLMFGGGNEGWTRTKAMVKELAGTPWPKGDVHLAGPGF